MVNVQFDQFEAIARSSDEAFILLTHDETIGTWNAAAEALFGYSEKEVRGNDIGPLLGDQGASRLHASFDRISHGGPPEHLVIFVRTKDDRRVKTSMTLCPIHDHHGAPLGTSVVLRRTSHRVSKNNGGARFSAVIDRSNASSKRQSTRVVFASWNPAAEQLFGYADYETVGNTVSVLVPPERNSKFRQEIGRILTGDEIDDCTCLRLGKAGRLIETSFALTPIRDKDDRVVGLTAVAQEATPLSAPDGNGAASRSRHRETSAARALHSTAPQPHRTVPQGPFELPVTDSVYSHWRQAFDQSSIPTAITSTDRHPVWVNDAYVRMLGYTREQLISMQSFADITHPDDVASEEKPQRGLLAGNRENYEREKRYLHADGHAVPVRVFSAAIRDESGSLIAILGQAVDLTQQKRAEAELRYTRHLTQIAFEQCPVATAILATDGQPIWANDAYVRMLGISRRKLLRSNSLAEVTHPDDLPGDQELFDELVAGTRQSIVREKRYLHADGHVVPARVFVAAMRDESGSIVSLVTQAVDLTDQRRAEEELRHASRFAHVLFAQSSIAAGAVDLQGRLLAVNDRLIGLSGYSRDDVIGSVFTDHLHPDDVNSLAQGISEYIAGTRDRDVLEVRLRHGDGHFVPVALYTSALRDDSGTLVGFIGQLFDLTEQKRAEAEREAEARFRQTLFDQSFIAAGAVDLQGRLMSVNDATCRLFGYKREEVIGTPLADHIHPDDAAAQVQGLSEYITGVRDSNELEVRFRHADGHFVPCEMYTSGLRDETGSLFGVIGQILDLTEQKRAEAEREAEARLRELLLDQSPIPAAIVNLQGQVQTVNDAVTRLSGYTRDELIGSPFTKYIHADDFGAIAQGLSEYFAGSRDSDELEIQFLHADGHVIPTRLYSTALHDDSGSLVGVIGQLLDLTEQKRAEEEREREARFRQLLLDQSPIPAAVIDMQSRLQLVNDAACRLLGRASEELTGSSVAGIAHPEDVDLLAGSFTDLLAGKKESEEFHVRLLHSDGHAIPGRLFGEPLRDDSGSVIAIMGQFLDESELRRAEEEREREARFRQLLFEQSRIATATVDLEGRLQLVNDAFLEIFGYAREELAGSRLADHTHPDDVEQQEHLIAEIVSGSRESCSPRRRLVHADGHVVPGRLFATGIRDDSGSVIAILGQFLDESELWRVEEQLEFEELHDPLTSLPARRLVADRVGREVEWARARHRLTGVAIVDIDRFDAVNEAFGRALADQLLVEFAQRLVACTARIDTVGRLEGDAFAIVSGALTDPSEMIDLAHKIEIAVADQFVLDNEPLIITASIGIALSSRDEPAERLLRDAELALGRAKEEGGNRTVVFDDALRARAQARSAAEAGLRTALTDNEFVLYYQPIVDLGLGRFVGAEALIRWNDPQRGLVMPDEFISTAEETGLIVPIGEWVMNEACSQMSAWNRDRHGDVPWEIAVNVSPQQVRAGTLLETVTRALDSSGLDPKVLTLELTETTFMENLDLVHQALDPLHELGVRMAIDDFGTGYSSLGRIRRFGIDILKIDQSFVNGLESDESARQLAKAILEMGRALAVLVIAEGVETKGQLEWLGRFDCRFAQGFLFARPVPADECVELLRQN
jgi:diguanylate cyclase (GGDEF)-like protein/PAS domain S-box-containing protein